VFRLLLSRKKYIKNSGIGFFRQSLASPFGRDALTVMGGSSAWSRYRNWRCKHNEITTVCLLFGSVNVLLKKALMDVVS
jgi:hypothetical protein